MLPRTIQKNTPLVRDGEMDVTIIQGGLRSGRDDLDAANEAAWATYVGLSEGAAACAVGNRPEVRSDLLVWPETVLRVYLKYGLEGEKVIRHVARASPAGGSRGACCGGKPSRGGGGPGGPRPRAAMWASRSPEATIWRRFVS